MKNELINHLLFPKAKYFWHCVECGRNYADFQIPMVDRHECVQCGMYPIMFKEELKEVR